MEATTVNANCDKCLKTFEIKYKKKNYGVDVIETYFMCPNCKQRYTSIVTNQDIRRKQKEIRDLNKDLHVISQDFVAGKATLEQYDEKIKEIDLMTKEIKSMMNSLKATKALD